MKKKYLNILLIIVITIIILYLSLKDNYREIMSLLLSADIRWLFVGYLLVLSYTFLKSIVTYDIINQFKPYEILKTFKLQMVTFFFNAITPFSTGGQPFQIYSLKKNGLKLSDGTNVIVQESIIHQLSIILIGFLALILNLFLNICDINSVLFWLLLTGFLLNVGVLIILFIVSYKKKFNQFLINFGIKILIKLKLIKDKEKTINKWNDAIESFNEGSKSLLISKKRFIKLILINCLALVSLYIVPLLILFSLGNFTYFNGIDAVVMISFVSIISVYVPLPGGIGGQEYLFILFFGTYLIDPLLGSVMILWRFLTYYFPLIIGGILFNIKDRKIV